MNKLSPAEMQWLNDFTEEYTHANFKHDGKILHKDKKLRKSCFGRNNARNRDTYSLKKSVGDIVSLDELKNIKNGYEIDVDAIIDKIDGEYED